MVRKVKKKRKGSKKIVKKKIRESATKAKMVSVRVFFVYIFGDANKIPYFGKRAIKVNGICRQIKKTDLLFNCVKRR